jgi:hypothetical protein
MLRAHGPLVAGNERRESLLDSQMSADVMADRPVSLKTLIAMQLV